MMLDPLAAKHIRRPPAATYKGVLRVHLGLTVRRTTRACRIPSAKDISHWHEGKSLVFDDTVSTTRVGKTTDGDAVVMFVDVLRPLPEPKSTINRAIVRDRATRQFVLDAKTQSGRRGKRSLYRERRRARLRRKKAREQAAAA